MCIFLVDLGPIFSAFVLDDHYLGAEKKQGLFQSSAIVTNCVFAVVLVHNLVFNKLTSFFSEICFQCSCAIEVDDDNVVDAGKVAICCLNNTETERGFCLLNSFKKIQFEIVNHQVLCSKSQSYSVNRFPFFSCFLASLVVVH